MAVGISPELASEQADGSVLALGSRKCRKPRAVKSTPKTKLDPAAIQPSIEPAPETPRPAQLPEGRCVTQTLRDLLASRASEVPPFARLAEDLGLAPEQNTVLRIYATSALYQAALGKTTVWQDINNRVEGKPGEREAEEPGGISFVIHEAAPEASAEESGL